MQSCVARSSVYLCVCVAHGNPLREGIEDVPLFEAEAFLLSFGALLMQTSSKQKKVLCVCFVLFGGAALPPEFAAL